MAYLNMLKVLELAEQCSVVYCSSEAWAFTTEELEKFAELIVQECVGVAADQRDWVENMVVFSERDEFWNKARIVQSQRIVDKIKQHFGVEE